MKLNKQILNFKLIFRLIIFQNYINLFNQEKFIAKILVLSKLGNQLIN